VTGSRSWPDRALVEAALDEVLAACRANGDQLTVVHGHAKSGVDAIADRWVRDVADPSVVRAERHPANWQAPCTDRCRPGPGGVSHRRVDDRGSSCPAAGFYRNAGMVERGADHGLAFIDNHSRGATHCHSLMVKAQIPVSVWRT